VNADEQTSLIFDFMAAIAPEVAHHHLRLLEKRSSAGPSVLDEDQLKDLRRQAAVNSANITLEIAMHLAAAFAQCQASIDETKPAQTQETAPADKPRKTKPIARIQPPAAGVLKGPSPVPDLPEHRD
jgi:hypothetical protein